MLSDTFIFDMLVDPHLGVLFEAKKASENHPPVTWIVSFVSFEYMLIPAHVAERSAVPSSL